MKNSTHNAIAAALCFATAAVPVGLILAAPVMHAKPATASQAEAMPRLIGFGCGPKAQTLLANEEDEFPSTCRAIEPVEEACAVSWSDGQGGEVLSTVLQPDECVAFWGDGY